MTGSPPISAEFTEASKANFRFVLAEVSRTFRKTMPEAIHWACVKFLQSARANTMVSRKLRDTRDTEDPKLAATKPLEMEVWAQGWTAPKWHAITGSTDPARVIDHRGAARNSWNSVFRGLGKPAPAASGYVPPNVAGAKEHYTGEMPYALVWNRLSYLTTIHPTLANDSLVRVTNQYIKQLDKAAKKALQAGIRKAITL